MTLKQETTFKVRVLKDLKEDYSKDAWVLKTNERSRRGVPDLIICLYGFFLVMELKIPGMDATPLQKNVIGDIQRAGGLAFTTDPVLWESHRETIKAWAKGIRGR